MIFGLGLLLAIWVLYMLLVKGFLWKIILGLCGTLMLQLLLSHFIPATRGICGGGLSWATVISLVVLILAMMHTKSE